MRIGISVTSSYNTTDPRDAARMMVERARTARLAGLDSLFVGDHHVTGSPYFQNTPMLARMLAEWGDAPFGALYLLPMWHPVLLAEQVATLASLGQGRFILQCGLGDHRQGSAMGIDMTQRVPMFNASLSVMQALWRGEKVSESRFWNVRDAGIAPLPSEPIDIWVGATVPKAIERTARLGHGWLASPSLTPAQAQESLTRYREDCASYQCEPCAVAIRRDMYVGESSEEAQRVVQPYVQKGYRGIDSRALLVGSVEQVAQQLSELSQMGYTDVIVRNISKQQDQCLASIERLAAVRSLLS